MLPFLRFLFVTANNLIRIILVVTVILCSDRTVWSEITHQTARQLFLHGHYEEPIRQYTTWGTIDSGQCAGRSDLQPKNQTDF